MPKTILVDFDGVIHSYISGWKGADVIPDPPVPGAIDWLKDLVRNSDFEIAIYSSRSRDPLAVEEMKHWLGLWGAGDIVDKLAFPVEKPAAWMTIDDRALSFNGWFPAAAVLRNFRPWHSAISKHDARPCWRCGGRPAAVVQLASVGDDMIALECICGRATMALDTLEQAVWYWNVIDALGVDKDQNLGV